MSTPQDPGDPQNLAELQADRETLRAVSDELITARLAIATVVRSLSPQAEARLDAGAQWVRVDAGAARILLEAADELGVTR